MEPDETPYGLLQAELARDGARPFITFYDDATGERIELSVITFNNWVAKTAGLLQDGLSVQPGDRVAVFLPAHWQGLVWAMACWAVGATVVLGDADHVAGKADVAVSGPETLDAATEAPEVIALSLRPLGGRFTEPLPPGVLDYATEVPGYPDHFVAYAAVDADGVAVEQTSGSPSLRTVLAEARERAQALGLRAGARTLTPADSLEAAIGDALLLPLVAGGSSVLVRHEDRSTRDGRCQAERVDTVVGG
jgi:uncharacterized protein (TIGR03089 family)